MNKEPFSNDRLFCPGPTPKPKNSGVLANDIYHRSTEFCSIFKETSGLLKELIGSSEAPLLLASSGTGAMEAAVVNFTNIGDEVIVVNGGKFGERWQEINEAYQCKVRSLKINWGDSPDIADIVKLAVRHPNAKALFIQSNETSTGVRYPIDEISGALKNNFKGLFIVDAISSIGAHNINMQDQGIDVLIGGSQKGFGVAPGLSFIGVSSTAWTKISNRPRFYFDLRKEKSGQSDGKSAFTPAIGLVQELRHALKELQNIGFKNVVVHHAKQASACRTAIAAMGLEIFSTGHHSDALTAIKVPNGIDGIKLLSYLKQKFGFYYAGGQDHLKGKIIRIAHLGFVNRFDLIDGISGLEFGLHHFGHNCELGDGTKALLTALAE